MQKGDIYYANLNPVVGSEQGGIRPVLIIQNDTGNKYSPTVIVAPITSKAKRSGLPTHATLQLHGHRAFRTNTDDRTQSSDVLYRPGNCQRNGSGR